MKYFLKFFFPQENLFLFKILPLSLFFKLLFMVKLGNNAFCVK